MRSRLSFKSRTSNDIIFYPLSVIEPVPRRSEIETGLLQTH